MCNAKFHGKVFALFASIKTLANLLDLGVAQERSVVALPSWGKASLHCFRFIHCGVPKMEMSRIDTGSVVAIVQYLQSGWDWLRAMCESICVDVGPYWLAFYAERGVQLWFPVIPNKKPASIWSSRLVDFIREPFLDSRSKASFVLASDRTVSNRQIPALNWAATVNASPLLGRHSGLERSRRIPLSCDCRITPAASRDRLSYVRLLRIRNKVRWIDAARVIALVGQDETCGDGAVGQFVGNSMGQRTRETTYNAVALGLCVGPRPTSVRAARLINSAPEPLDAVGFPSFVGAAARTVSVCGISPVVRNVEGFAAVGALAGKLILHGETYLSPATPRVNLHSRRGTSVSPILERL